MVEQPGFSGPPMVDGDPDPTTDYDLCYKCDTQNQWLPIPKGFIVLEDADNDATNNPFM